VVVVVVVWCWWWWCRGLLAPLTRFMIEPGNDRLLWTKVVIGPPKSRSICERPP
jgi:hypothetical protein